MFMTAKYIRTSDNQIIIFQAGLKHSEFGHFNPVSAGFVRFGVDANGSMAYDCYGKSESLRLESAPDDSWLATRWIVNPNTY